MNTSSCMCEPMETAQSLGDDTHAVVTRLRGHQSTDCTVCGPLRRWVESLAHPMRARTRTRANVNVRHRPLLKTNRQREKRGRDSETKETAEPRMKLLTPAPHTTQYTAQHITTTHFTEATTTKKQFACVSDHIFFSRWRRLQGQSIEAHAADVCNVVAEMPRIFAFEPEAKVWTVIT